MRRLLTIVLLGALAAGYVFRDRLSVMSGMAGAAMRVDAAQAAQRRPDTFLQASRRAIAHGKRADAETLAKARPATDPDAAAVLAMVAQSRGQYDEARALLEKAATAQPTGEAALQLALLLKRQFGRAVEATPIFERILARGFQTDDDEAQFRAARAGHELRRMQEANALFRSAAVSADPAVEQAWGEFFVETEKLPEALKSFQRVMELDPEWAPAYLGLANTLAGEDSQKSLAAVEKASTLDPGLADAQLFLAGVDLDNDRTDAARERINRILKENPAHLDARALLAAIAYVNDDTAGFEAEVARVLAINPAFGEIYRAAGSLAARNYRFEEAVALTRKATALDPNNIEAASELGLHLMRTGEEAEARQILERSFQAFPFKVVTLNLLQLLDKLQKFEVRRDGNLTFKFDPDDAKVLPEYAIPLAKEALAALSKRYQFTPTDPLLIELFPVHDDFAVRNLGLPGMIGALGACFGKVVTQDSPRAKAPGSFSWQSTLWHELAHVVTLQLSKQRIPRWLTEGISVYEENRARPVWGREMEVPFAIALERGKILKLRDLNSGFTKAETIALSYYQASLVVSHIVATHGEAGLRTLVKTYGEGLKGDAAIKKGLGVSIDELQTTFDAMLEQRFASVRAAVRDTTKGERPAREDISVLKATAAEHPGSYRAQLTLGMMLAQQGDKAAFEPLEKAAALVPMASGSDSPHALMGALAEKLGDPARAMKEYTALLAQDETALEEARRLADLATKANDPKLMALANDRIVELDPFDASGHTSLGNVALRAKDAVVATREFKVALAVGPPDRASAHCDLAESYLLAGKPAEAKREALAALEIAPSFERAQDLLLKAIDGK